MKTSVPTCRDNKSITDVRAYWTLTLCAAVWGFSWLCGRVISAEGVPPAYGAFGRFAFGSLGLLAIMLFNRPWPRLTPRLAWKLGAMGFTGVFLYNVCFFTGLKTVPAGRGSLMAALQPSVVFLFSALVWGETIRPWKIAGLALSFFGATLVLSQGDYPKLFAGGLNTGDLWILGCVVSWVSYTLIGRLLTGKLPAVASTAYSTWLGTVPLAILVFVQPYAPLATFSTKAWLASAFLGLLGTSLAFLLFLQGVGHIGPARASIFINLVPVFGVLFSSLILQESLSAATLAGGALTIAGVRLLNR
ncbi:MAG: DMT family transporter [Bryobacteraceae bacterium]|nr:DMT family transporter [Bryobacteraceae bacterium]